MSTDEDTRFALPIRLLTHSWGCYDDNARQLRAAGNDVTAERFVRMRERIEDAIETLRRIQDRENEHRSEGAKETP